MGRSAEDEVRDVRPGGERPGHHERGRGNAFDPHFLAIFDSLEEPPASVASSEFAGPWQVVPDLRGFSVRREGETAQDEPEVIATDRPGALLAAAVLPALGQDALYRLEGKRDASGRFELFQPWGRSGEVPAGSLRLFVPELAQALHVAGWLVRSPTSLAAVLEAAGATALARAGKILQRRVEHRERVAPELLEQVGEVLGSPGWSPLHQERLDQLVAECRERADGEEDPLPRISRILSAAAESLRRTGNRLQALSEDSDTLRAGEHLDAAFLTDLAGACGAAALAVARELEQGASPGPEEVAEWRATMEEVDRRLRGVSPRADAASSSPESSGSD